MCFFSAAGSLSSKLPMSPPGEVIPAAKAAFMAAPGRGFRSRCLPKNLLQVMILRRTQKKTYMIGSQQKIWDENYGKEKITTINNDSWWMLMDFGSIHKWLSKKSDCEFQERIWMIWKMDCEFTRRMSAKMGCHGSLGYELILYTVQLSVILSCYFARV